MIVLFLIECLKKRSGALYNDIQIFLRVVSLLLKDVFSSLLLINYNKYKNTSAISLVRDWLKNICLIVINDFLSIQFALLSKSFRLNPESFERGIYSNWKKGKINLRFWTGEHNVKYLKDEHCICKLITDILVWITMHDIKLVIKIIFKKDWCLRPFQKLMPLHTMIFLTWCLTDSNKLMDSFTIWPFLRPI